MIGSKNWHQRKTGDICLSAQGKAVLLMKIGDHNPVVKIGGRLIAIS
jgi:hypothetical protein